MKFVFGFPADSHKNTIILVFSDRFSNIVHLVTLPELITASHCACVVIVIFFRLHGLPREPMFYRDPRFTDKLQRSLFKTIGTRPIISITDNIETYGQKERANRVFEDILRGYIHFFTNRIEDLSMIELVINISLQCLRQQRINSSS